MIHRIITIVVISAGPMEVRGPLRPHTLQWPKAGPADTCNYLGSTIYSHDENVIID